MTKLSKAHHQIMKEIIDWSRQIYRGNVEEAVVELSKAAERIINTVLDALAEDLRDRANKPLGVKDEPGSDKTRLH